MPLTAITSYLLLTVISLIQALATWIYLRSFRQREPTGRGSETWPRTAVILSLRGDDPQLADSLDRLAALDYPGYELHIIVDHETDPAAEAVAAWQRSREVRRSFVPVSVQVLRDISLNAYLKTSAVRQCLLAIADRFEAAVIVDADTRVYPGWLRDMVRPLLDSKVGLVTGNRWYDPATPGWGSMVRFIYNANAVMPMHFMRATWGGSMAIRRGVFQAAGFAARMSRTSCEDAALQDLTRQAGLKIRFQSNAMMWNDDPISLPACFRFMRRQLLWTRLYHPGWSGILCGTSVNYGLLAGATIGACVGAASGDWISTVLHAAGVGTFALVNWLLIERLHVEIGRRIRDVQGIECPAMTASTRIRLLAALSVALVAHTLATVAAAMAQTVRWRGITYQVVPPDGLRLMTYVPYRFSLQLEATPPTRQRNGAAEYLPGSISVRAESADAAAMQPRVEAA